MTAWDVFGTVIALVILCGIAGIVVAFWRKLIDGAAEDID